MSVIFNEPNLAYTASPTQGTVTSDTGTDAIIPAADGTNAGLFLPAEKTKLAGIAEGAEVNVNADWNASSGDAQILNKPTLGTAAATNSTDYATAAQGAKADTAVQPAAIGSTVLAFDSNLQSFVNAFTLPTTDGTAGQSLVTNGAGVISFATPAILADPVYIGGVAYFNRSTKPTERSAGVPLVIRDRWYNTSNGTEWFWNGTYWLSSGILYSVTDLISMTSSSNSWQRTAGIPRFSFIEKVQLSINGSFDVSNYHLVGVFYRNLGSASIHIESFNTSTAPFTNTPGNGFEDKFPNLYVGTGYNFGDFFLYITWTAVGSPSMIARVTVFYRLVAL